MDISKLNVQKACDVPKRMSLYNPFTKETLLDDEGKTLDIFVYGIKSNVARNAKKERDRKYGSVKSLTKEQETQSGAEFLAALTQGYTDNIENADGPYKDALTMYLEQDWIAEEVLEYAYNIGNYNPNV